MSPLISTSLASSIIQVDGFKASAVKTLRCYSLPLLLLRMSQAVQENEGKSCIWVVFPSLFQDQPLHTIPALLPGLSPRNKLTSGLVTVLCNGFISKAILKHWKTEVSS